jgi:hypothetical protein
MRTLKVSLDNILSLVSCADDYGFNKQVLMEGLAGMMDYKLSDDEIEQHARDILLEDGFGIEDYQEIKESLIRFKKEFIEVTV